MRARNDGHPSLFAIKLSTPAGFTLTVEPAAVFPSGEETVPRALCHASMVSPFWER